MQTEAIEDRTFTARDFERTRRYADTEFGRIAYVERGSGPAALFVHGALLNGFQWRHQLAGLSDIRRVIAVDSMAMGHTEINPGQSLRLKDHGAMLRGFVDELGIDAVDLVGNDSGGGAAQIFAATNPERVRTLTLTNSEVDDYDDERPAAQQFRELVYSGKLGKLLEQAAADPAFAKMAFASAYQNTARLPDDLFRTYLAPFVSPQRLEQLVAYFRQTAKQDLIDIRPKLKALRAPVLVLWGTADPFFAVDSAHWLRDNLKKVEEVLEIDGAPVFWPEEQPELLNRKLREFWTRHSPPRGAAA
jgi:pimeloyl-ACP methyl ester carboxylesterase